jgi:hypothetical protein
MKKIISILLLLCLLLNIIGYHLIFHLRQAEIKAEMKKVLRLKANKDDEIVFVFSLTHKKALAKLEWEDDHEFRLNGEMYDVIERKIANHKLVIRCISDKKETALIERYEKMNTESNSRDKLALLLKFFANSYLPSAPSEMIIRYKPVPSIIHPQTDNLSSQVRDVSTPPPQLC